MRLSGRSIVRAVGTLSQRAGESGEWLPFPHFARVAVLLFLNQCSPSRITMGVGVGVLFRAPVAAPGRAGGHALSLYVHTILKPSVALFNGGK